MGETFKNFFFFISQCQQVLPINFCIIQIMESEQSNTEAQTKRQNIKSLKMKIKLNTKKTCQEQNKNVQSPKSDVLIKLKHVECQSELKKFMTLSQYKEVLTSQSFDDYFELMEKLGEGAHSSVYRCIQKETGIEYAAKFFKKMDPQLILNAKQTYHIMKKLNHPYIAQGKYLFISYNQNSCQLITQYFQFQDLRNFLNKKIHSKAISEGKVADIIDKVLQVLSYLQEKGVCHRDIKPENILYNEKTDEIKLIDFQLARMHRYSNERVQLWTNTGSPHYRAPESFNGGYNQTVDMWALGVVAYEMLTGHLPFFSRYDRKIIHKICHQELTFPEMQLSEHCKNFLRKILCKDPASRLKPEQARRHPFILKNARIRSSSISIDHNSSFEITTPNEDEQDPEFRNHFYDQSKQFCFLESLSEDIGIRISGSST